MLMAITKCPACGGTGEKIDGAEMSAKRTAKDLTLKEVSEKMGISIQYLSDLEKNKRNWSPALVAQFNKAVGQ